MINTPFYPITLADQLLFKTKALESGRCDPEYSFANFYVWQWYDGLTYTLWKDCICILKQAERYSPSFFQPLGHNWLEALPDCIEYMQIKGWKPLILHFDPASACKIRQKYPEWALTEDRDYADYIYAREDLADLPGRKFMGKRNRISKFERIYPGWQYQDLTPALIPQCLDLYHSWAKENPSQITQLTATQGIERVIREFQILNLSGGVIIVNNNVVALSLGEPNCPNCFTVYIEIAQRDMEGLAQLINREFVRHATVGFAHINREQDMGIEGLRTAKLSYKPAMMLSKYTLSI